MNTAFHVGGALEEPVRRTTEDMIRPAGQADEEMAEPDEDDNSDDYEDIIDDLQIDPAATTMAGTTQINTSAGANSELAGDHPPETEPHHQQGYDWFA